MGFKLPKIKIKAPKIKFEPAKLVKSAVDGATVLPKAAISGAADVAGTAVAGAGQVMSQPGAGAVLGAAGAAFGVPGAGLLADMLTGPSSSSMNASPAPLVSSSVPTAVYEDGPEISNTMLIAGAAFIGLVLVVVLFLSKRGKR